LGTEHEAGSEPPVLDLEGASERDVPGHRFAVQEPGRPHDPDEEFGDEVDDDEGFDEEEWDDLEDEDQDEHDDSEPGLAAAAPAPPPVPAPAEPPTEEHREVDEPGGGDEDLGHTVAYDVEPARPERSASETGSSEDDVLEETPEFLQDTPDHDRLWFEQKPPRDFDFDE
jgi:hypothetical protein